jgi:isoquinoline 1-oxidoreductase beta subunit
MSDTITPQNRRAFIKNISLTGGGLMLGFSWWSSCSNQDSGLTPKALPEEWFALNSYLKIGENGLVTIVSPNPEAGQNVKTSMPMIIADELDVDWKDVMVEQAPLDTAAFSFQFIGGSQAIRRGWPLLRKVGATARRMLMEAAADHWEVAVDEITTEKGVLYHRASNRSMSYGAVAALAAQREVPEEVALKNPADFSIIGTSQKNVDGQKIVTGQPLFGVDTIREGLFIAMIIHPPAFGMRIKSFDASKALSMPGIRDVFQIEVFRKGFEKKFFDTISFPQVIAVVGKTTWEVMQAKKAVVVEYELAESDTQTRDRFGSKWEQHTPAGLEDTAGHYQAMESQLAARNTILRKDGNPERAFGVAAQIIERTYTAPFLAHNCMEPMNFFADVRPEGAFLRGPLQKPEYTEQTLADRLGIPSEKIEIEMTRLGGGYGRRSYAHWAVEAALISQRVKAPVKLMYSREDDMTGGIYRPSYQIHYKAGLDDQGNLIAFAVNAGGIPETPIAADRFPAGAVDHYMAESWTIDSNITVGSFRAPRSNFMASAEQSFLDEVAELAGKDPIDFRLELLRRAAINPVGSNNDYDPVRYAGVLELVKEKSNWKIEKESKKLGVSAYFCHNSYVAQVLEIEMMNGAPKVQKVVCAIDCGRVINPDAAKNMAEGGIVDGIGNAMYGELTFKEGVPEQNNFHQYRMIRMKEAPDEIEVHFVENDINPTGLGEPSYPPTFAALANALYQATGQRLYRQPFVKS